MTATKDNGYYVIEYTTEQLWGVVVEADTEAEATKKFDNGDWHGDSYRIGDRDKIVDIEGIFESTEDGDPL